MHLEIDTGSFKSNRKSNPLEVEILYVLLVIKIWDSVTLQKIKIKFILISCNILQSSA